ncbi:unnamed protein product [Trichobilharzia szidati]|nr:unnamed protein product [Trichobilharzia szidati]
MLGSRRVSTLKSLQIYRNILTLWIVICEAKGEVYPSRWKNSEADIDYRPVNRMMTNAPLDNTGHNNKNNNNNDIQRIETRSAGLKPPIRPKEFKTVKELNSYLKKLRDYYFIVGRPSICQKDRHVFFFVLTNNSLEMVVVLQHRMGLMQEGITLLAYQLNSLSRLNS